MGHAGRRRLLRCLLPPPFATEFRRPEQRAAGLVCGVTGGGAHIVVQIKIGLVRDEECDCLQLAILCGMVERSSAPLADRASGLV